MRAPGEHYVRDCLALLQAADKYEAAWQMQQTSHAALYNWGVALSDIARVVKPADKEQAHRYLQEAADKYAMSLQWNPNNPQVPLWPRLQKAKSLCTVATG